MGQRPLTEREREILSLVVQAYIRDAAPVGSRSLARRFGLSLSPATIRNTMNDLESAGFLEQPHTSAGRVPTDHGYRVYVDQLMMPSRLSSAEQQAIREAVVQVSSGSSRDAATILHQAVRALGEVTHLLAVSSEPRLHQGRFEKIELVGFSEHKVLAVLNISKGFLRTVVMELDVHVERDQLEETARLLNERLAGLPIRVIRDSGHDRVRDVTGGDPKVLKLILNNADELFAPASGDATIHHWGTPHILSLPEFADRERMLALVEALENKDIFLRILRRQSGGEGLTITIGEENPDGEIGFCSIVTSPYRAGEMAGSVGVVGPTRMEYARLVSAVDYTARLVGEVLRRQLGPEEHYR